MSKPWFRVKRIGYGTGLPCSWEGWAATFAYLGATLAVALVGRQFADARPVSYLAAVLLPSVVFVYVAWRKSDQPWRWRNGEDES